MVCGLRIKKGITDAFAAIAIIMILFLYIYFLAVIAVPDLIKEMKKEKNNSSIG